MIDDVLFDELKVIMLDTFRSCLYIPVLQWTVLLAIHCFISYLYRTTCPLIRVYACISVFPFTHFTSSIAVGLQTIHIRDVHNNVRRNTHYSYGEAVELGCIGDDSGVLK